jgi:hypothetical protein
MLLLMKIILLQLSALPLDTPANNHYIFAAAAQASIIHNTAR